MRRSADYNDLLLKAFIKESFIQYKKEDLFERKSKTEKKYQIHETFMSLSEEIDEFVEGLNKIIEEGSRLESKYSIRNILSEDFKPSEAKITAKIEAEYAAAKEPGGMLHDHPGVSIEDFARVKALEAHRRSETEQYQKEKGGIFGFLKDYKQEIMLAVLLAVSFMKINAGMNPAKHIQQIPTQAKGTVEYVMKGVVSDNGKIDPIKLGEKAGVSPEVAKKLAFKIEKQSKKLEQKVKKSPDPKKEKKKIIDTLGEKVDKAAEEKSKSKKGFSSLLKKLTDYKKGQTDKPIDQQLDDVDADQAKKAAMDDLKDSKDGAVSTSQNVQSGKANHETFKHNVKVSKKNVEAGAKLSKASDERSEKMGSWKKILKDAFTKAKKGESKNKTKGRFADRAAKSLSEIFEGIGHAKIESKYQDGLGEDFDFKVKTQQDDRLGDASKTKGKDTSTGKRTYTTGGEGDDRPGGMEQLDKLNTLKSSMQIEVRNAIKSNGSVYSAMNKALNDAESNGLDADVIKDIRDSMMNEHNPSKIVNSYANDYVQNYKASGIKYNHNFNVKHGGKPMQSYGQSIKSDSMNAAKGEIK